MFYFALTVRKIGKDHTRILAKQLDIMVMMIENIDASCQLDVLLFNWRKTVKKMSWVMREYCKPLPYTKEDHMIGLSRISSLQQKFSQLASSGVTCLLGISCLLSNLLVVACYL